MESLKIPAAQWNMYAGLIGKETLWQHKDNTKSDHYSTILVFTDENKCDILIMGKVFKETSMEVSFSVKKSFRAANQKNAECCYNKSGQ